MIDIERRGVTNTELIAQTYREILDTGGSLSQEASAWLLQQNARALASLERIVARKPTLMGGYEEC